MKKPLMIGTALLLTAGAFGAGVAASESHFLQRRDRHFAEERESRPMRLDDRDDREHHGERHEARRSHHERHEGRLQRGRGALSENGPIDPNAPTPDNGLFNKGARPKVEVQ